MSNDMRPGTVGDLIAALSQLDPSTEVWYFNEQRYQYEQSIVSPAIPFSFMVRRFKTGSEEFALNDAEAGPGEPAVNVIVL